MTSEISLRTARAADYDPIIAVVDEWWGRPIQRALPRLFLDHFHNTSLIAERPGGELAGFLVGFASPAQQDRAYIQFVGVAPDQRGTGLARLLYQTFFDWAARESGRGPGHRSGDGPGQGVAGRSRSAGRWTVA
jgi:predicted GNAT superfamily acetyltransferase